MTASDSDLEAAIQAADLDAQYVSIVVADGVATLWGTVETKAERLALGIAAGEVAGADRVDNHLDVMPALVRTTIGSQ